MLSVERKWYRKSRDHWREAMFDRLAGYRGQEELGVDFLRAIGQTRSNSEISALLRQSNTKVVRMCGEIADRIAELALVVGVTHTRNRHGMAAVASYLFDEPILAQEDAEAVRTLTPEHYVKAVRLLATGRPSPQVLAQMSDAPESVVRAVCTLFQPYATKLDFTAPCSQSAAVSVAIRAGIVTGPWGAR